MSNRRLMLLAFAGFITLGLPLGAIGVAWPSMAESLDQDIAALGMTTVFATIGFVVATTASGHLSERWGTGPMVGLSAGVAAAGMLGHALAPAFWTLLLAALVFGLGGGLLDAGTNAFGALRFTTRSMNLLHASFGVGATVGPLLMGAIIGLGGSWRLGYVLIAAMTMVVGVGFWRTQGEWATEHDRQVASESSDRLPVAILLVSLLVFFLHTGVELSAGQWAFSLFTEERGISDGVAGLWVGVYWAAFTASRLVIGIVGDGWIGQHVLLRLALGLTVLGAFALWFDQGPVIAPLGLVLMGFALGPVFPALMLLTPERVGSTRSSRVVGYEISAANLGAAGIAGGIGLAVGLTSLEAVGPFLAVGALLMLAGNEWLRLVSRGRESAATAGRPPRPD